MTLKSKLSRLLSTGKRAALMRRSTMRRSRSISSSSAKSAEDSDVIDAFRGALPGDLVVLAQEGRQLQRLEVVGEQHLRCVGHAPSPDSRLMYDLADVIATRGARQIRIDVEVEPGRPPLDAAQYQVLHRIKADCAEPQGVADRTLDLLEPEGLQ